MIFKEVKDFTIIDTETTGLGCYSKLVEFAALKFRDGKPVESFNTLVNPKMIIPQEVIKIHGITNEKVQNAPTIEIASNDIYNFIKDDILVAHNAPFDVDVLNRRLLFGLNNKYIDSLSIFRNAYNLPRYRLDYIRSYFGIEIEQTHRALDDVNMLYKCLLQIDRPYDIEIRDVSKILGSCRASQIKVTKKISNKLENCHCVITGEIPNYPRNQVWQLIVNNGGLVGDSVINKTKYLILGSQNVGSSKLNKAMMKKKHGDDISIISYQELFEILDI